MEYLGYVAAIGIGLILGMLGGGGSILSIPVLVYLFAIEPVRATAYSLFIVGATSVVGVIPKYRSNLVNLQAGIVFGLPSVLTIFITRKWFIPLIPETVLTVSTFMMTKRMLILVLFAVLMLLASIPMIRGGELTADRPRIHPGPLAALGLFTGFITGVVGAGGGFLIIPALVFLAGLPFKVAGGTSLLIIAANSLIGFIGDVLNLEMNWRFLLSITFLAVLGILLGTKLSQHVSNENLRKAFGWFVIVVGSFILLKELIG